jgi:acetyltransferase
VQKPNGRDLFVGIVRDKVFGPTLVFGPGGSDEEVPEYERAVALPPLNAVLVADLLASTRSSARLGEYRGMPPVNMKALETVLLHVSEMVCELPWISEMNINPLIIDETDAVAVDARISIHNLPLTANHYDHMAIHPYPSQLTTSFQGKDDTTVTLRPIKPEDARIVQDFIKALPDEARYLRFMNKLHELSPTQLMRMTQIDYHREMAFIATVSVDGREVCVGDARYATNPDGESCEFAIVVADSWQGKGLARRMMGALIETARSRGVKYMNGDYLVDNGRMIAFVSSLGFVLASHPEDPGLKRGVLVLG